MHVVLILRVGTLVENLATALRVPASRQTDSRKNNVLFEPFLSSKADLFAKTGSGQT
eukprot:COSAG06_NODE_9388_length_1913_cov_8.617971_1_plen_57_part_00